MSPTQSRKTEILNTSSIHQGYELGEKELNKGPLHVGIILIVLALILGGVQDLHVYSIYGSGGNKWYFYSFIGIVLLIGIALVTWSYARRQKPQK